MITKLRLFLESEEIQLPELNRAKRVVYDVLKSQGQEVIKDVFNVIKDNAWTELPQTWQAIIEVDEIYASSSLVPLYGAGTYTGAPVVMDAMMQKAISENVTGKSVFFLRPFKDIWWEEIDMELLKKAFVNNDLYTLEEVGEDEKFIKVDISNFV